MFDRTSQNSIMDRLVACLSASTALTVTLLFAWITAPILWRGAGQISWRFLTEAPERAGLSGGIGPIIVSTLAILFVCLAASVPLGLATAALLAEFTSRSGRFGRWVRLSLDVLAGVPSIVFGLFGNAFFCIYLNMGRSILSGGLTLACMVLPLLIRATEEGFRSVSDDHRRAAAALGLSKTSTLVRILLPLAVPGLVVGLVLGIGRALAETAALLFTSGASDRMPETWWDSGRSLSIHIYTLTMDIPGGDTNAYSSALILVVLLLVINLLASTMTTFFLSRRLTR